MKKSIVWFTTDLRLYDNETLLRAIENSDEIIPVYCFDEAHFQTTEFGFLKTGTFRTKFIFQSLSDLDNNLRSVGSGLVVLKGKPEEELLKLALQYQVEKVFTKNQTTFEEKKTLLKVAKALGNIKVCIDTFETDTLYHESELPFAISSTPDVFTDFRRKVEKLAVVGKMFEQPEAISSPVLAPITLPELKELGLEDMMFDNRSVLKFSGGETEGRKRLHHYLFVSHAIASYKETRNGMVGSDYSSKFSPWLASGCLSPRMIYHEIKKYEAAHVANESTYWLFFELLWREYFKCMLKKYPIQFFRYDGINKKPATKNKHDQKVFEQWKNGQTANDFINANIKELNATGFMSNRGRQNVASYFCHDLKLDWRYGAAYFEQQLIDYEVSANWCNWAYIAGVGNNPRGISVFNIDKQANNYDHNKSYRNLWLK